MRIGLRHLHFDANAGHAFTDRFIDDLIDSMTGLPSKQCYWSGSTDNVVELTTLF